MAANDVTWESDELAHIYRTVPVGLCLMDTELRYIRINEMLAAMNGIPVEQHIGRVHRNVLPEIADQTEPIFRRVVETGEPALSLPLHGTTPAAPQEERDWLVSYFPLFDGERVCAVSTVVQEITQIKRAEAALRRRLDLETLIVNLSSRFINLRVDEIDLEMNRALEAVGRFAGADRSYVFLYRAGTTRMTCTHEWRAEGVTAQIQRLQDLPTDAFPWFSAFMKRRETMHVARVADLPPGARAERAEWQLESIQSLVNVPMISGGALIGFVGFDAVRAEQTWTDETVALLTLVGGVFANTLERKRSDESLRAARDSLELRVAERTSALTVTNQRLQEEICERTRAQESLRESEQRLQAILDYTTAVIYVKDLEGKFILINRRFEDLFHVQRDQVVGKTDLDLFPVHLADAFQANDRKVIEMSGPLEFEEVARHDDGDHTYISIKFPLLDTHGHGYAVCGISTDITERMRAEEAARAAREQLRLSERLASLGTLASGIAHEINNPVASILLAAQNALALRTSADGDRVVERALHKIEANARRCGQIVRSVLQFARRETTDKWDIDVNEVLQKATRRVREYAAQRGARILSDLTPSPLVVMANPVQLEQVFENLMRNAIESRDAGAEIRLRSERSPAGVSVVIEDNGKGITAEQRRRLFDPFYTTRHHEGGTGLGLPICHGIISEHCGEITVSSQAERGTAVTVTLPPTSSNMLEHRHDKSPGH